MTDFELIKELANRLYVRGILDNNPNSQTGNVFPLVFGEAEINFHFDSKGNFNYTDIDAPLGYSKTLVEEFFDIYLREDATYNDLIRMLKKITECL